MGLLGRQAPQGRRVPPARCHPRIAQEQADSLEWTLVVRCRVRVAVGQLAPALTPVRTARVQVGVPHREAGVPRVVAVGSERQPVLASVRTAWGQADRPGRVPVVEEGA